MVFGNAEDFITVIKGLKVTWGVMIGDDVDERGDADVAASLIEGTACLPGILIEKGGTARSEVGWGEDTVPLGVAAVDTEVIAPIVVVDGFNADVEEE